MALAPAAWFPSLVEAQIALGVLRSAGIEARLPGSFEERPGSSNPVATRGVRIWAPQEQCPDVERILAELRAATSDPDAEND